MQWTNALVLGVQQLVMALRVPAAAEAGVAGFNSLSAAAGVGTGLAIPTVQSMAAAQDAMRQALTVRSNGEGTRGR